MSWPDLRRLDREISPIGSRHIDGRRGAIGMQSPAHRCVVRPTPSSANHPPAVRPTKPVAPSTRTAISPAFQTAISAGGGPPTKKKRIKQNQFLHERGSFPPHPPRLSFLSIFVC